MSWSRLELSQYVDGELTLERSRALETHLAMCAPCSAEVATYRRIGDTVRMARPVAQTHRLRPGTAVLHEHDTGATRGWPARLVVASASAVALVLLAFLLAVFADRVSQPRAMSTAAGWPAQGAWSIQVAVEGDNQIATIGPGGTVHALSLTGSPWALATDGDQFVAGTVNGGGAALEVVAKAANPVTVPLTSVSALVVRKNIAYVAGSTTTATPSNTTEGQPRLGSVTALSLTNGSVRWQQPAWSQAPGTLAVLASGQVAVANASGTVTLLDGATGAILASAPISGPVDPLGSCLAMLPDTTGSPTRLALVNTALYTVDILGIEPFTVQRQWHLAPASGRFGWLRAAVASASSYSQTACGVSPDGATLYIAGSRSPFGDALLAVDVASGTIRARMPAPPGGLGGLAQSPDGRWLYTSAIDRGELLVVDAHSLTLKGAVRVGNRPRAVVVTGG